MSNTSTTRLRNLLADAMQNAWNDFTSDTGNFPDCFELEERAVLPTLMRAEFGRGNFAEMVAGEFRRLIGDGHFAVFTDDGWTVEHDIECRLSGFMADCEYTKVMLAFRDDGLRGRYHFVSLDGGEHGFPQLERT